MLQICWMSEEGGLWLLEEQIYQWTHASHAQHLLLVLPVIYFIGLWIRSGECQRKVVCEFWRNKSTSGHMQVMHSICYSFYLLLFYGFRSGECQRKEVCEFWRNKFTSGHMQAMHSICYSFYLLIILWICVSGLVNVRERWSVSSGGTIHQWTHANHAQHLLLVLTC